VARRDRYHRLEFMRRWLARDGLLDVLLVRVDALRPATIGASTRSPRCAVSLDHLVGAQQE
jgi:hypothetical protein